MPKARRKFIKRLYHVILYQAICKRMKKLICRSLEEAILVYGWEIWSISERYENRLKVVEIEYWKRRNCNFIRLNMSDEIRMYGYHRIHNSKASEMVWALK